MNTDPIADMLTRIRNAIQRRHTATTVPYSRIKESIAKIFLEQRFICGLKVEGRGVDKQLVLTLVDDKQPVSPITALERISRPSRRVYSNWRTVPHIKSGRGLVVVSTNQGLMTGHQARNKHLGGEVLCSIY